MASGRPRHGLGPSGELTGGGGEGITCSPGISRAPALASQTSSGSHPRSASRCLPKKSAQRFPAQAGCPARQGAAPAGHRRAPGSGSRPLTSGARSLRRRSPGPAGARGQSTRVGGGPSPPLGCSPHPRARSRGCARPPSSEVLAPPPAGVSVAGAPAARSVSRGGARRRPSRPEADSSGAAPPARPEPRRRGPRRPLPRPLGPGAPSAPARGSGPVDARPATLRSLQGTVPRLPFPNCHAAAVEMEMGARRG